MQKFNLLCFVIFQLKDVMRTNIEKATIREEKISNLEDRAGNTNSILPS